MRAIVVPKQRQPGHAVLRLLDLGAEPDGLTLRFERRHPAERYLSENGWQKSEAWLAPERIEKVAGGLEFHIGPVVGDVLAGLTVRVAVREPGIGTVGETVVAWPNMLTSGAFDASRVTRDEAVGRTVRPEPQRAPEPPPPPPAAPPPPAPEPVLPPPLRAERVLDRQPRQSSGPARMLMLGTLFVLAAAIAGGAWYFWPKIETLIAEALPAPTPPQTPPPAPIEKPLRVQVAEFLAGKPTNDQILAKGREFLTAGKPDGAFLLWRAAADTGDAQASLAFAQFYDPVAPIKDSPVQPNGETAAQLYERAARGEQVEAMRRLGILYARGHASLPADRAKARDWLKRAADKGDAAAKQELDKLR